MLRGLYRLHGSAEVLLPLPTPRSKYIVCSLFGETILTQRRVLFPGALNSEFTNTLSFLRPAKSKDAIPTYRCLNQYGEIIDKSVGADTTDEEALELYKNMVTRNSPFPPSSHLIHPLT